MADLLENSRRNPTVKETNRHEVAPQETFRYTTPQYSVGSAGGTVPAVHPGVSTQSMQAFDALTKLADTSAASLGKLDKEAEKDAKIQAQTDAERGSVYNAPLFGKAAYSEQWRVTHGEAKATDVHTAFMKEAVSNNFFVDDPDGKGEEKLKQLFDSSVASVFGPADQRDPYIALGASEQLRALEKGARDAYLGKFLDRQESQHLTDVGKAMTTTMDSMLKAGSSAEEIRNALSFPAFKAQLDGKYVDPDKYRDMAVTTLLNKAHSIVTDPTIATSGALAAAYADARKLTDAVDMVDKSGNRWTDHVDAKGNKGYSAAQINAEKVLKTEYEATEHRIKTAVKEIQDTHHADYSTQVLRAKTADDIMALSGVFDAAVKIKAITPEARAALTQLQNARLKSEDYIQEDPLVMAKLKASALQGKVKSLEVIEMVHQGVIKSNTAEQIITNVETLKRMAAKATGGGAGAQQQYMAQVAEYDSKLNKLFGYDPAAAMVVSDTYLGHIKEGGMNPQQAFNQATKDFHSGALGFSPVDKDWTEPMLSTQLLMLEQNRSNISGSDFARQMNKLRPIYNYFKYKGLMGGKKQ